MDIEKIKEMLENKLSEKRYKHSLGVMKCAKELAIIHGENADDAEFAGLIHDIAKELTKDEIDEYINKYNIEVDEIEKVQMGLLHSKIGAIIAREEFGASAKIQDAIKYHTTGNVNMDKFAKIIYIADKIEENRDYEGVDELRKNAREDLDTTILAMINFTLQKSIREMKLIHPDSVDLRNFLIKSN